MIVKGNISIGSSGRVVSEGTPGGSAGTNSVASAGAGGGNILILHAGAIDNSGTISAPGGSGGTGAGPYAQTGGSGGDGSVLIHQIEI